MTSAPPTPDRSAFVVRSGLVALLLALLSLPVGLLIGPDPLGLFLSPIPAIAAPPISLLTWIASAGYTRELRSNPARAGELARVRRGVRLALLALPLAALGGYGLLTGLYAQAPWAGA